LRIGLATARAIALAAGCPAVGVSTFEAIAAAALEESAAESRKLVIAIDTKRDDLYFQAFACDGAPLGFSPLGEAAVCTPAEAVELLPSGALLLAGDGARMLHAALGGAASRAVLARATLPDAADVAAVAALRLVAGAPLPPLRPLYLRAPAARLPQMAGARS
jgi:tRNA threonylcarbamoyladenosine biosynthesis protein TsaB